MLDPDYLNAAGEMTAAVYTQIESEMLEYLTKRMIEGDITNQRSQTALLLLSQSNSQGLLAILNSHKGEISASVSKEVSGALKRSDADDLKRIKKGMGVELPSITSRQIATTVAGVRDILARENLNMVQSAQTAFLTQSIWAITQVNTGAMTTEKALHSAVRKLEGEGISLISYRNTKTGRQTVKNKVDVAIRRHIRTQILQDSMRRTEQILDDAGVELVEVSSHGGARPSHAEWEGRVYSRHGDKVIDGVKYKDFKTACKWGDVADGIGGANCRHSYSAYFPGMKRMYEPDPEHPSGKSNVEVYDLTQKQRSYERDIRDAKRELSGAEQLYKDNPTLENQAEAAKAKLKLQNKQAKMRELINDNPGVLQRSPRREWAGDMPKVKVPKASGRKIDDFLESKSKQLSKAGISKTRMKSALSTELGELGLTTRDFSRLTTKDQVGLFEKVKKEIPPSNKKPAPIKPNRVKETPLKIERTPRIDVTRSEMDKEIKKAFEGASGKHISLNEHMTEYEKAGVTKKEHSILYGKKAGYIKSHNYQNINTAMREHTELTGGSKRTKELLEEIITRNTLEEDTVFYRMDGGEAFIDNVLRISMDDFKTWDTTEFNERLGGKSIPDDAFKSVSSNVDQNYFLKNNRREVHCIVKAKKGTNIFFTDNMEESEAIFAPGVNTKIGRIWVYNIWSDKPELRHHGHGNEIIMEILVG